jgi:hypothetical protein
MEREELAQVRRRALVAWLGMRLIVLGERLHTWADSGRATARIATFK